MSKENDWPEHPAALIEVCPVHGVVRRRTGTVRFDDEKPAGEVVYSETDSSSSVGYSKTYAANWTTVFGPKAQA